MANIDLDFQHICDECGAGRKSKAHLFSHIENIHFNYSSIFTCDLCSKGFRRKSTFGKHIRERHQHVIPIFECDQCASDQVSHFTSSERLRRHRIVAHRGIRFKCDECGKVLRDKNYIITHINSVHKQNRPFECGVCGAKYAQAAHVQHHIATKHKGEHFICDQCGAQFQAKFYLYGHIENIHRNHCSLFACDLCSTGFSQKHKLAHHIRDRHHHIPSVFECQLCAAVFRRRDYLKVHMASIHQGIRFQCDHCGKLVTQKSHLISHITSAHQQKRPLQCGVCGKLFKQILCLRNHMASIHQRKRPFRCEHCGKRFGLKSFLVIHITTVHQLQRPFQCCVCEAAFTQSSHLQHHIGRMHKGKQVQCYDCGKPFAGNDKGNLAKHILSFHMQLRSKFKCDLCPAYFSRPNLKRHMSTVHHGIKYECDTCGKLCGVKRDLAIHIISVHQRLRPFQCGACGVTFSQTTYLNWHIAVKHNTNAIECDDCGANCGDKRKLRRHIHSVHMKLSHLKHID